MKNNFVKALGVLLVASAALVWLLSRATDHAQNGAELTSEAEMLVPPRAPKCTAGRERALDVALERERAAHARWERAPFALEDAPLAIVLLHEAIDCFAQASHREGRQRAERSLALFQRELERRYVRERLGFLLARRHEDDKAVLRHGQRLLALISQSEAPAKAQRSLLDEQIRRANARLIELSRKEN